MIEERTESFIFGGRSYEILQASNDASSASRGVMDMRIANLNIDPEGKTKFDTFTRV